MTSYNDINNTKAVYSNISLEDMGNSLYNLVRRGSKKWYVYKCQVKGALADFGKSFKTSS